MSAPQQIIASAQGWRYTTFDPANKSSNVSLGNGNRIATINATFAYSAARMKIALTPGKVVEFTIGTLTTDYYVGAKTDADFTDYLGGPTELSIGMNKDGDILFNTTVLASGDGYTTGDKIGIANLANTALYFMKNGAYINSVTADLTGTYAAWSGVYSGDGVMLSMEHAAYYLSFGAFTPITIF